MREKKKKNTLFIYILLSRVPGKHDPRTQAETKLKEGNFSADRWMRKILRLCNMHREISYEIHHNYSSYQMFP